MAPSQRPRSALIGFLTRTGMSTPRSALAISWMENGLTVVRAPIQRMSIPRLRHSSTCSVLARHQAGLGFNASEPFEPYGPDAFKSVRSRPWLPNPGPKNLHIAGFDEALGGGEHLFG